MGTTTTIVNFRLTQGLQSAFQSIIIAPIRYQGDAKMAKTAKPVLTDAEMTAVTDPFENPEAWKSLWLKAGACAAKEAQDENARMGINSPGAINGRLAVKTPDGKIKLVKSFDIP